MKIREWSKKEGFQDKFKIFEEELKKIERKNH
jgi:hypothetical protein